MQLGSPAGPWQLTRIRKLDIEGVRDAAQRELFLIARYDRHTPRLAVAAAPSRRVKVGLRGLWQAKEIHVRAVRHIEPTRSHWRGDEESTTALAEVAHRGGAPRERLILGEDRRCRVVEDSADRLSDPPARH